MIPAPWSWRRLRDHGLPSSPGAGGRRSRPGRTLTEMTDRSRLQGHAAASKVMPAEDAAAFIAPGDHVGMSGFTGSGHPKAVPAALVRRVTEAAERGDRFT